MRSVIAVLAGLALLTGCALPRGPAAGLDNASASQAIKARMLRSQTNFSGVDVRVVDGVVLLMGHVTTDAAKEEAGRIAWSAPNVRDVGNELHVTPEGRTLLGANDQLILSQVRARLTADRQVRARTIHVEVYDGVVYLLGRARTSGEVAYVADEVSRISGVERVVSFLAADMPAVGQPLRAEPYEPPIADDVEESLLGGPSG